jgi:hypothetical protein
MASTMLAVFISNDYWTWWDVFFMMFIWIPMLFVWGFAIFDVFVRRDLSGWGKAAWLLAILLVPLIGVLAYLLFRPYNDQVGYYGYYGQPTPYP